MNSHQCDVIEVSTIRRGIKREVAGGNVGISDINTVSSEGDVTFITIIGGVQGCVRNIYRHAV